MPRNLPDVTIVVIDHLTHQMVRMALEDSLREITPAATLIFSDQEILDAPGTQWIKTTADSKDEAFAILWNIVPNFVETSHYLHIEWDGWVLDSALWNDNWLRYDYIGAPWPWHHRRRVGNGGFSLRSLRLGRFLQAHSTVYPMIPPEDDTLCRVYRPNLEKFSLEWAPEEVAREFSIEHGPIRRTFGFHDCRNWPRILAPEQIALRRAVAPEFFQSNPSLIEMEQNLARIPVEAA